MGDARGGDRTGKVGQTGKMQMMMMMMMGGGRVEERWRSGYLPNLPVGTSAPGPNKDSSGHHHGASHTRSPPIDVLLMA